MNGLAAGLPFLIKPDHEAVELNKLEYMVDKTSEIHAFGKEVEQWRKLLAEERKKDEMHEKGGLVDLGNYIYPCLISLYVCHL